MGALKWAELKAILDRKLVQLIAQEKTHVSQQGPYPLFAEEMWRTSAIPDFQRDVAAISHSLLGGRSGDEVTPPATAVKLSGAILEENEIDMSASPDLYLKFCEATLYMYIEYYRQRLLLNEEARLFSLGQTLPATPEPIAMSGEQNLISDVVDVYCNEMMAGGNWTEKTLAEYRAAYALLIRVVNDMPIAQVDHQSAQHFKTTMLKLPSNMSKRSQYRDKSIDQILAMKIPKDHLLSITKVNAYIGRVSSLFNWAVRNGYVRSNPFAGLKVKEKVAGHEKRLPFSDDDLAKLFSSKEYGMANFKHPYQYWLPLLGLYTGARIEELCQLDLDDIYEEQGLWVLDINSMEGKKLKTMSSRRRIPIHSRLIDLGFAEYVIKSKKSGGKRLFPELKKRRDGYSQGASRWFGRYRQRCGVTDERKPFHSFRHTVMDRLKQKGVAKEHIVALAGHKDESMTTGWYGKPYEPAALVPVVEQLQFPVDVASY